MGLVFTIRRYKIIYKIRLLDYHPHEVFTLKVQSLTQSSRHTKTPRVLTSAMQVTLFSEILSMIFSLLL